jgi:hypothetical protein
MRGAAEQHHYVQLLTAWQAVEQDCMMRGVDSWHCNVQVLN